MSGCTRVHAIDAIRRRLDRDRNAGARIGFVPTMGAFHDGHLSLFHAARAAADLVVASVFVNPLQFGVSEDLSRYPRDLERDVALAEEAGVDVVFAPDVDEMYPRGAVATRVSVPALSRSWEGTHRPTHFDGVATVVAKLFSIVGPCVACFGEKDWQQLAVLRRMVCDLSMPIDIRGCPTVRGADGLALSSRNAYLDVHQRAAATVLRRALDAGLRCIASGERDPMTVDAEMAAIVNREPLAVLDYAATVESDTLERPARLAGESRLLVAARFGEIRLIDNAGVTLDESSGEQGRVA